MFKKLALAVLALSIPCSAHSQVTAASKGSNAALFAGGELSAFKPDYNTNWLYGGGVYVDFRLRKWLTAEGEARWLRWNQVYDVHEDSYLVGPKITWRRNKWEPYGKFLMGAGEFNFPYSYAHGGWFEMAAGAGVDYHPSRRWSVRAIDFEYQSIPSFPTTGLSPWGISTGVAYRIF